MFSFFSFQSITATVYCGRKEIVEHSVVARARMKCGGGGGRECWSPPYSFAIFVKLPASLATISAILSHTSSVS